MVVPPPEEDETPEDEEIPDEEDEPTEEDELSAGRCGSTGVMCANLAPTTAAAAADSRPTRQVIFLTRRRPSSRARGALKFGGVVTA